MITVLTATYNRKKYLPVLFESLCQQSDKDFEWLIIDDGSTDGTEGLIPRFREKANFKIKYERKANGGKHTALNYSYQFISTLMTFIVDSDDWLTPDAITTIKLKYEQYKSETDLCGFSFLRGKPGGGYLSSSGVPIDGLKESYIECRVNRGIDGDMAEVWYTDCLKEYPFPEFEGEKFLGEDIIWIKMAQKYKMRFFNNILYISEYIEDGLTKNRRKHNIRSPKGCVVRAEEFLSSNVRVGSRIKAMLQYQIYGRFAEISLRKLYSKIDRKALWLLMYFPSLILASLDNGKHTIE